MANERILFIEDDRAGRELGEFNLKKAGYRVDTAANGEEGLRLFSPDEHALVVTDLKMPGVGGLEVLRQVKGRSPETPVVLITAYASVDSAVEAMKEGALDFIGKPFKRDHLLLTVRRALEGSRLRREVRELRISNSGVERPIIHTSEIMRRTLEIAQRLAATDATVLIRGESGTGKELIARYIHVRSDRAQGPFVPVNLAAMPADLLEAELFGHERGAFTGAVSARAGRFRQAHGGTLLLDEVGELPGALQGKLLRVLQERVVDVLGSDVPREVDVRIIAATNRDLETEVREGRFREDLYYRLNVVDVEVPPLSARKEDVEVLARHFIALHSGGRELEVPDDVIEELRGRAWPGNVRQLENACRRMVALAPGGSVRTEDLPGGPAATPEEAHEEIALPPEGLSLLDLERRIIERVLAMKGGNVSAAAAYLGVPRHVLAYRMEKYGIARKPD